jgi:hypothetical protein
MRRRCKRERALQPFDLLRFVGGERRSRGASQQVGRKLRRRGGRRIGELTQWVARLFSGRLRS